MGFQLAVRSSLSKSLRWQGRASRSEFWYFALFYIAAIVAASVIDQAWGIPLLSTAALLGLLVPAVAVTIRRLHDTGKSGWWYWLSLIPFAGAIIMVVLMCLRGDRGPNRFGSTPSSAMRPLPDTAIA